MLDKIERKDDKAVLRMLESLGLELSAETGGCLFNNFVDRNTIGKDETGYIIDCFDHKPIHFLDGELFLKSVTSTEETLKVKLFDVK